ncbi:glycoside hydrolase family 3 C-terminal domain-containing protein [Paenibacillus fonticola]|uniref:glycoside hydrolase family 3 C-terminal domain-containing protein n=1 Tax=Paenibacillus fonticola TaxID=379896 RepID=UPI0003785D59
MEKIKHIISEMTLEEKAAMCSGANHWFTKPLDRLGIPSIMMQDGPHGLRKQDLAALKEGKRANVPMICFPTGAALACSWDRELVESMGKLLGQECQAENVDILLGPGVNIKRSPLCGRNFEYYSEDPHLSSELAASYITGIQSQGVGASLKHFVANNQEHNRYTIDEIIDERTLREIYLASFESAVKKAKPWTIMGSFNKVNGTNLSENKYLLTDVLKEEWGFEGLVVSDWGAVDERADGIAAGLDLEMPYTYGSGENKIIEAVKNGTLKEEALNKTVERILGIVFKAVDNRRQGVTIDKLQHHESARKIASECLVLLKNNDNVLPLKKDMKVAIVGEFAEKPRYQGGGSSRILPYKIDSILDEVKLKVGSEDLVKYARGYKVDEDTNHEDLIAEAVNAAQWADVAIVVAGLPDSYETEGTDREHMRMPESHNKLIQSVAAVQKNVVVVLCNGSPVEMPWINDVKGLLEAYLGGQAVGGAISDIIFGDVNPSGKLAETFPQKLSHNPSFLNFPGEGDTVHYREGIFVGYRYYDKKEVEPLFPFGFGLSYTKFEYSSIRVDKKWMSGNDTLKVNVKVKNIGDRAGKEIIQLYVSDMQDAVIRPVKELKGFEKVMLDPMEEKSVTFELDKRAFAFYDIDIKDWRIQGGKYTIMVGSSSKNIHLTEEVNIEPSPTKATQCVTRNSLIGRLLQEPLLVEPLNKVLDIFWKSSTSMQSIKNDAVDMIVPIMKYMPLRQLVYYSEGGVTEEILSELIRELNDILQRSQKEKKNEAIC